MNIKSIRRLHEHYHFWCKLSPPIDPAKIPIHKYGHFGSYGDGKGTRWYGFLTAQSRDDFVKNHNAQRINPTTFLAVPTK